MSYKDIEKKRECARKWVKKHRIHSKKAGGENWILMKCKKCSKQFYEYKDRIKENKGQFCSRECKKTSIIKMCEGCKKEFRHMITNGPGIYCSNECRFKYMIGSKIGRYKDGLSRTKEAKVIYAHIRRVRKMNNGGTFTVSQWEELKKKTNYTCWSCMRKEPDIKLTQDHIVPIALNGNNTIDNIQPLCLKCNMKKGTRIIKYSIKENIING